MEQINKELERILSLVNADEKSFLNLLEEENHCVSKYRSAIYGLETLHESINSGNVDDSFYGYFEENFAERVERLRKAESALKEVREQIRTWILEG